MERIQKEIVEPQIAAAAAEAAKDVLDNNTYHKQEANYGDLWLESNKNSSEFMFCLHHSHANKVMASNYGKSYYPVNFFDAFLAMFAFGVIEKEKCIFSLQIF